MKLSVIADLRINQFSGATITELESGVTNGVVHIDKVNKKTYLSQRPSIDVFEDASEHIADARGRGIYYWDGGSALYIVNNDNIYKDSQSNSINSAVTAGTKKCTFLVLDDLLILLNPEGDEGFTINTSDTVTEITDAQFPPKLGTPVGLAYGGAVLNGYLFVLGENGFVYNSNLEDATAWTALDYLNAEREPDGGVYLGKHHDNLAVLGVRTVEFFYFDPNTTAAPISRREDVSYNIGCSSGESVWEVGDEIFFVSTGSHGALGVHMMKSFGHLVN